MITIVLLVLSGASACGAVPVTAGLPAPVALPACGVQFTLPPDWEFSDEALPEAGCRILLRPRSWPEKAEASDIVAGEYPVLLHVSSDQRDLMASRAGFKRVGSKWTIWGMFGPHETRPLSGASWVGFLGEVDIRTYYKKGGYAGMGSAGRTLILVEDGRTAVFDEECCVTPGELLKTLRFVKPRPDPKLDHDLVPGAHPLVRLTAWGRCGFWETSVMSNGVSIQRTAEPCPGYSPRQPQARLDARQVEHLWTLIQSTNFNALPSYIKSLLNGAIPDRPRRIRVWLGDEWFETAAAEHDLALDFHEGDRFEKIWSAVTTLVPPP